jgi:hypothetical protein
MAVRRLEGERMSGKTGCHMRAGSAAGDNGGRSKNVRTTEKQNGGSTVAEREPESK